MSIVSRNFLRASTSVVRYAAPGRNKLGADTKAVPDSHIAGCRGEASARAEGYLTAQETSPTSAGFAVAWQVLRPYRLVANDLV